MGTDHDDLPSYLVDTLNILVDHSTSTHISYWTTYLLLVVKEMIELIFGGIIYGATLLGCYDGDTCRVRVVDAPPFLAEQVLRFEGFDTPEIRGKCRYEKHLAKAARDFTRHYFRNGGTLIVVDTRDKYGRLVVSDRHFTNTIIDRGLARPYDGGKRKSWCQ